MTYLPDIKWGIIDYYGQKKTAFDYVARAYQPVLVSLEYTKRRWRDGETLEAAIWVVNDHHHRYDQLRLGWRVLDSGGGTLHEGVKSVSLDPDSSEKFHDLSSEVRGSEGEFFTVELSLTKDDGTVLSENFHTLSIGDQERAKTHCVELHRQMEDSKQNLGKGYYRYHPELQELD